MYNEIMESINKIDSTIMEAEVNVASALVDAYSKAAMIMEYCDNDAEVETFGIIQECFIQEGKLDNFVDGMNEKLAKKPDESVVKKILLAIPRLLNSLVQKISNAIKATKMLKVIDIEKLEKTIKDVPDDFFDDLFDDYEPIQEAFNPEDVQDLRKDLTNLNVNDKTALKKLMIKFVKMANVSFEQIKKIKEMIACALNIFKNLEKFNASVQRSIQKGTKLEQEAALKYIEQLKNLVSDENILRLVKFEDEILGISGRKYNMLNGLTDNDSDGRTFKKNMLETFKSIGIGLANFTVRIKTDLNYMNKVVTDISGGMKFIINSLQSEEFDTATKNSVSGAIRMLNNLNRCMLIVNKMINMVNSPMKEMQALSSDLNRRLTHSVQAFMKNFNKK